MASGTIPNLEGILSEQIGRMHFTRIYNNNSGHIIQAPSAGNCFYYIFGEDYIATAVLAGAWYNNVLVGNVTLSGDKNARRLTITGTTNSCLVISDSTIEAIQ